MIEQEINPISNSSDLDKISLKEHIQKINELADYLKTNWKIIFLASFFGATIGLVNACFEKPTYKAVLTFVLEEDKGGGLSGALGLASSFGIDFGSSGGGGVFAGSNLIELMKSRLLVEKTLLNPVVINGSTISIAEYYIQINKLRENWSKIPKLKSIQFLPNADRSKFSLNQNSILNGIYSSLIRPKFFSIGQKDKKVSITSIEIINENENFAKVFCENLATETSKYYIEIKSKKARTNLNILQRQTDSIRAELNNAITGVASANDNVFNLNSAMNIKKTLSTRRQVDVQANTAMLNSLVANLEMSKMALRKETPLIQIIDSPTFPLVKKEVSKLNSIIVGSLLSSFLTAFYLIFSSLYKKLIA